MSRIFQLLQTNYIQEADAWLTEHPGFFDQEPQASHILLKYALNSGSLPALQMLVQHGADVNGIGNRGATLMRFAAQYVRANIQHALFLMDQGIDIHRQDDDGNTALSFAAASGEYELVTALIDRGVDLDVRGQASMTALMWAAQRGHLNITQKLVASGASVLIKTDEGETVLDRAKLHQGQSHIAEYLAPIFLAAEEKAALDAVTQKAVTMTQMIRSSASEKGVHLNAVNAAPLEEADHHGKTGDLTHQPLRL